MVREGSFERWIALEMGNLQRAFVSVTRPLPELLQEETPSARTRGGEPHVFDKDALARVREALGPLARRRLRLPVTFYVDKDLPDDAYVPDETAAQLLRGLGEVPETLQMREGRLWIAHSRARAIADRHPTVFQFAYH